MSNPDSLDPQVHCRAAPDPPIEEEEAGHVLDVHRLNCPRAAFDGLACPCEASVLVYCTRCGEALVVMARTDPMCACAARLLRGKP